MNDGFNNDINYTLNDASLTLDYKFRIGKWINTASLGLHQYTLKTQQTNNDEYLLRWLLKPQWRSEWEVKKGKKIVFRYQLNNNFPQINQLADRYTVESYNSVFKGNSLLKNERFNYLYLRYTDFNFFKGATTILNFSYGKKRNLIRNKINLQGINHIKTPVNLQTPETSWNFYGKITRRIYRFGISLHGALNGYEYAQNINGVESYNIQNSQNIGTVFKITYRKWPDFSMGYTHQFNQFRGDLENAFQTQKTFIDFDHEIIKHFILKTDYSWNTVLMKNTNNRFQLWNASLFYQKEESPFGFELKAQNILNTKNIYKSSFSDFLIYEQSTAILPRVLLLSIHYKL